MSNQVLPALTGFARTLAAAGPVVGAQRTATFVAAVRELGTDPAAIYWAGRLTLLAGPDDRAVYDRVFAKVFGTSGHQRPTITMPPRPQLSLLTDDADDGSAAAGDSETAQLRARASAAELLRHKDFANLTTEDRRELSALWSLLRTDLPDRAARRQRPHHRGPIDRRRTTAAIIRAAGEAVPPRRHRHTRRPRRIVLLIDVSGSMEPYADSLLRFAHVLARRGRGAVEIFTIGTRLTRVTRVMGVRDAEQALATAATVIPDWSGGTRLGEGLQAFLNRWGRRGTARGAVVVVFSDGWERGSVTALRESAAQLQRLARQLIWVNPHKAKAGYRPVQGGIAAVAPHLDSFVSGHSIAALQELLEVMADA